MTEEEKSPSLGCGKLDQLITILIEYLEDEGSRSEDGLHFHYMEQLIELLKDEQRQT